MAHHFRKTRIAPTPSGYLHAGNACSFLLTAALAKKYGAAILLRIDDIDQERARPEYIEDIFETLHFLHIPWTEGPRNLEEYRNAGSQSARLPLYNRYLSALREKRLVFACACTRSKLSNGNACECEYGDVSLDAPDVSWRLKTTGAEPVRIKTLAGMETNELPAIMDNYIVRRRNGLPAYQLASAADDLHFGIDLVVRGSDLFPSTVAQCLLMRLLGETRFEDITFHHHPLVKDTAGNKLSKSEGAFSVREMRRNGATAADLAGMCGFVMEQKKGPSSDDPS